MSNIDVLPHTHGLTMCNINIPYSAICSVGKKPFWGTVLIEYKPQDLLLEFVSVEDFVKSLGTQSIIIEDVAQLVFYEISRALGDIPLRVSVNARTTVHAPVYVQKKQGDWKNE